MLGELKFKSEADKLEFINFMRQHNIEFVDQEVLPNKNSNEQIDEEIENLFKDLCILPHIKGYSYAKESIKYIYSKENVSFTKELYPYVADKFNTKPYCVDRALRQAIELSFNRIDADTVDKYYGNYFNYNKGTIANSEFLHICTNIIKRTLKNKGIA